MRVMLCVLVFWSVLVCRLRLRRAVLLRVRLLECRLLLRRRLVVQRLLVRRLLRLRLLLLDLLLLLLLLALLWRTWFLLLWLLLVELLLSSFKKVFATDSCYANKIPATYWPKTYFRKPSYTCILLDRMLFKATSTHGHILRYKIYLM
jgi:hypothetical protein